MFARRLTAIAAALALSFGAAAQEVSDPLDSLRIPNWTAPPFWTPPLPGALERAKEDGGLETMAIEGLPTSPLPFFGITPCRLVDTRPAEGFPGAYGAPAMVANATRDFDLNSAPHCPGVPASAQAYSLNVTVTQTTGLGDIRIWPTGNPPASPVSTQNWPAAGSTIANAAIVPAGTSGSVTVQIAGSDTHLIIDINGYYAPVSIVNTVNGLSANVTLAAGSNVTITPSGQTLTIANTAPAAWSLTGNAGTTPGTHFLGTTDNQALELKVNSERALRIETDPFPGTYGPNIIGGFLGNFVTAGKVGATIGGGGQVNLVNRVTQDFGHVGGGWNNHAAGYASVVVGGRGNTASGGHSTLGAGQDNVAAGEYSTIGGGSGNAATNHAATVTGGVNNSAGIYGSVVGGANNNASGNSSFIGGGVGNVASSYTATVPGGSNNAATAEYAFAAGRQAKANHDGAFVWADSTAANLSSTASNQFIARATGGFAFVPAPLVVCTLTGVAGWQCGSVSDRDAKRAVVPVDGRDALSRLAAMPIHTWSYKDESPVVKHMGPMAQDFAEAYGLGATDKTINPLDANGVALAAIQGLYEIVKERDAEIEALKARLSKLEAAGN